MKDRQNFKVEKDVEGRDVFFMDSYRIDESINFIRRNNLRNILVTRFYGYKCKDLSFLLRLKDFIEGLTILDDCYDLVDVNSLGNLKTLGFADNKKDVIDLSNFPNLKRCAVEYSPRLKGLSSCANLSSLTLSNYKSESDDLSVFPKLKKLTRLMLVKPKVSELAGIGRLANLKALSIFRGSELKEIYALKDLSKTLEEVEFDSSKKINDYHSLGKVRNLRKIIIFKSGEIQSLEFVKDLKKLEFISFVGTNIVSGDLTPCVGIKYVGFDNKRHYSHRPGDFRN